MKAERKKVPGSGKLRGKDIKKAIPVIGTALRYNKYRFLTARLNEFSAYSLHARDIYAQKINACM